MRISFLEKFPSGRNVTSGIGTLRCGVEKTRSDCPVHGVQQVPEVQVHALDSIAHLCCVGISRLPFLGPEKVDLTGEEDLKRYVEAGNVKNVRIESVKYNISQNTLNYDLPNLEMYMDDHDVNGLTQASQLIATLPPITAGTIGPGEVQWATNGQNILSDYMMLFKFAIIGVATVEIDTAQNRAIPSGQMAGTVEVKVKFSVDPI